MKTLTHLSSIIIATAGLSLFTACERETESERAGEAIEDATDGASDAVEDLGDDIEDATD